MKAPARTPAWKKLVAQFPREARPTIDAMWEQGGRVAAADVAHLTAVLGTNLPGLMLRLLPVAQQYAGVPLSHFHVGAVAAGQPNASGHPALYLGANLEFPGIALSATVHAEQSATNHAWLSGETGLTALAITAAPCGYCRQFLNELKTARELTIYLPEQNGSARGLPLAELLPRAFGPSDLGIGGGLMDPMATAPHLELARGSRDELVTSALDAARTSYAPYATDAEGQYAGVALEFADGRTVTGRYAGNAAYNPSLSPLQSALAYARVTAAGAKLPRLRRCVLVEVPTLATQRGVTAGLLAVVAPGVKLEYHPARVARRRG